MEYGKGHLPNVSYMGVPREEISLEEVVVSDQYLLENPPQTSLLFLSEL